MKQHNKHQVLWTIVLLLFTFSEANAQKSFKDWPMGTDPATIGQYVANHYIASAFSPASAGGAQYITDAEACTWYGALQFAKATNNKGITDKLIARYEPFYAQSHSLVPPADHAERSVFGILPLELYIETNQSKYLDEGKTFADKQWQNPSSPTDEQQKAINASLSWQSRLWADDAYMIPVLQTQAFRATNDKSYIDRAATEMVYYLNTLQQPDGLFFHATDAPILWSRGNGWVAAGMTELLISLPKDSPDRPRIMDGYKKMMAALKKAQDKNYLWHQVLDDETSFAETSGSAMFTYAFIVGVKKGWLDESDYGAPARNAWMALVKDINEAGDIKDVCESTPKKGDKQYYLNRERRTGDLHGQAPVLWCAAALLAQ
jgi:unsaturated rhamnogalacturonyl hydrolase